jgi:hypothetical protein
VPISWIILANIMGIQYCKYVFSELVWRSKGVCLLLLSRLKSARNETKFARISHVSAAVFSPYI